MEYCLPHAVLALLQEENSPNSPKSYFISSSTKNTKITLIYARRKNASAKSVARKGLPRNSRERYSSSGTDDYSHRTRSESNRNYVTMQSRGHNPRICASTPGRGYNDAARVRGESGRHLGTAKMPTDPLKRSPSKDHLTIGHFASSNHGSDSDISNHYAALSPHSLADDRPPTPGKQFFPSSSPRPPTPNFSNYTSLLSGAHGDLTRPSRHSPSREPTVEYDSKEISPPPTPCLRRDTTISNKTSKAKVKPHPIPNPNPRAPASSVKPTPPSISVQSASPATPPKQRRNQQDASERNAKPYYYRNQSWEDTNPHGDIDTNPHGDIDTNPHGDIDTNPHGDIDTNPHGDIDTNPHGDIDTNPHGDIDTNPHGDIDTNPHGDIIDTNPHGDIDTNPHGDIDTNPHGDIIDTNPHGDIDTSPHGDIDTNPHGDIDTSPHGDIDTSPHVEAQEIQAKYLKINFKKQSVGYLRGK
nr:hypothetical protein BgiMline_016117 [Biomphalaria glabrata]